MPKRSFDDPNEPAISRRQVGIVLRALYPGSPINHRALMLARLARKGYRGRLLAISFMVVENFVRHHSTLYEQLIYAPDEHALNRADARQVVAGQVAAIIASWQQGSAMEDPEYQAIRQALIERRLEQGPSPELTRVENDAIVDALTYWLEKRGEAVARKKRKRNSRSQGPSEPDELTQPHLAPENL